MFLASLKASRSVAVVGASGNLDSLFGRPMRYLTTMGYTGRVFPVNPKYDHLAGLPCYPSVVDIPEKVDVGLVLVAADTVPTVLEQLGQAGAEIAIVCASGFAEAGTEGESSQTRIKQIAEQQGLQLLGPNSQGAYIRSNGLALTFNPALGATELERSGIGYVGQSGALGASVAGILSGTGIGIDLLISTGNEAGPGALSLAHEALELDDVSSLIVYAETIKDSNDLIALGDRSATLAKPVVLMIGGFSRTARAAATSHTGALAPPNAQVSAVAEAFGMPICQDPREAVLAATTLQQYRNRKRTDERARHHGLRVGMLSTSGGAGVLAADLCDRAGIDLPRLERVTRDRLARVIPAFGSTTNPVDVTAEMQKSGGDAWTEVCTAVGEDTNTDLVWISLGYTIGEVAEKRCRLLAPLVDLLEVPVIVSWLAPPTATVEGRCILAAAGIPVADSLPEAVRLIKNLSEVSRVSEQARRAIVAAAPDLDVHEHPLDAGAIRSAIPIRFPASVEWRNREEGESWIAEHADATFVVKAEVPGISHKSDWGGVRTGLAHTEVAGTIAAVEQEARQRFATEPQITVEEQIDHAYEMLVGYQRPNPQLPGVMVLGWGGFWAEAIRDTVTFLCVPDRAAIDSHLQRLRIRPVLDGFRGLPEVSMDTLTDALFALAEYFASLPPGIRVVEINPLALGVPGGDPVALDLLVTVGEGGAE